LQRGFDALVGECSGKHEIQQVAEEAERFLKLLY